MYHTRTEKEYREVLKKSIRETNVEGAIQTAMDARNGGLSAGEVISTIVMPTISEVWQEYLKGESGLPGPVISMSIAHKIVDVLREQLPPFKGTVVVGTMGTFHDLGKNLVKEILYLNNYNVFDIGSNAEPEDFIKKAMETDADIIACNCMALLARPKTKVLMELINARDLRGKMRIMVGGAVMTREWAEEIGADGYGDTMMDAASLANAFMDELRKPE
jgi:methanogenic corrinoid protein MtbC1